MAAYFIFGSLPFSIEKLAFKNSGILNLTIRRQFKTIYKFSAGKKLLERVRREREIDKFKRSLVTLPNALTLSRLALSPLFPVFLASGNSDFAFGLLAYCGISDILDGWIARNFNQRSAIGSVLDPVADKITVLIFASSLLLSGHLPFYLCSLIVSKDLILLISGVFLRFRSLRLNKINISRFFDPAVASIEIKPLLISKMNTVLQFAVLGLGISPFPISAFWLNLLQLSTGFVTVITGVLHLFQYRQVVNKIKI